MKKPNHSNDSKGQNYDPNTGKYISDSDAGASENPIDQVLLQAGIVGDFSGFDWDDLIAKANAELQEQKPEEPSGMDAKTQKGVDEWLDINNIAEEDRKGIIGCLNKMDPALRNAYCKAILSKNELMGTRLKLKKGSSSYYCAEYNYYSPNDAKEYIRLKAGDIKFAGAIETPYESFFHELGHCIDHRHAGKNMFNHSYDASYGLLDAIKGDVEAMGGQDALRKRINEYVQNFVDARKSECKDSMEIAAVAEIGFRSIYMACDMMNLLEGNNDSHFKSWYKDPISGKDAKTLGFGHLAKTLKSTKSQEFFAEMCEAEAVCPEGVEFLKKSFPTAYKSFKKRLEKI